MTPSWSYPYKPTLGGVTIDFVHEWEIRGQNSGEMVEMALPNVQSSPGEWTIYMMRQLPEYEVAYPMTPTRDGAMIESIVARIGSGGTSFELPIYEEAEQITPNITTPIVGATRRCQTFAFHGDLLGLRIRWRSPQDPLDVDRLTVWISPGRPARFDVPFRSPCYLPSITEDDEGRLSWNVTTGVRPVQIPIWATQWRLTTRIWQGSTSPATIYWRDLPVTAVFREFRPEPPNINIHSADPANIYQPANAYPYSPAGGPEDHMITGAQAVPPEARWMWLVWPQGGPPISQTANMHGVFECYG